MPLEYFIEELTPFGKIVHGSTFSEADASKAAIKLSRRTKNPVTVTPLVVPYNQIEDFNEMINEPINVRELFEEIYGKDAELDEQNSGAWFFLQLLSETANEVLADYKIGILTVDDDDNENET